MRSAPHLRASPRRHAGLSMVELMVAMVIALIGTIIMFQVFEVSEGIKRTTTSGGDAQTNGVVGLFVMENDLRQAGNGFNDADLAGCTVLAYDKPPSGTGRDFSFTLVPVSITSGGNATVPDSLTVLYGSQQLVGNATTLLDNMPPTDMTASLRVMNRFGFRAGDLLILKEPGTAKNCAMMEVTSFTGSDYLNHATGNYPLDWMGGTPPSKTARANKPGGFTAISPSFAGAGTNNATRVFNMGNLYDSTGTYTYNGPTMPVLNTYAISNNTLTVASAFTTAPAASVVDNIVHMRALYGLDDGTKDLTVPHQTGTAAAGDGKIDRFVDAPKFAGLGSPWSRIVAVKIVLVARSTNPERASDGLASSPCDTTNGPPTWSAQDWPAVSPPLTQIALDVSTDPNWKCYRYKVFETTVPLRNWIWKSS